VSDVPAAEPLDPRVAELLSALLDGAVSAEERATAEAWLARSPAARAEYESLAQVKAALGGMGEVEPPFGFYERMLRQGTPTPEITSALGRAGRSNRRWLVGGAVAVAAAAAAVVLVAGGGGTEVLRPPVEEVAAGTAEDLRTLRVEEEPVRVLRQEADGVDWDELPDGERGREGGADTWVDLTTEGDEERVIVSDDGVVVTLAAEGVPAEDLIDLGLDLLDDE
jgi:hypothetical protein